MLHPAVFNTSQLCYQLGVRHAVMSPGSRNAPLTLSFARHKNIEKWVVPDERTAAFMALGMAQYTKKPVVLCCTSGSAVLNYAPAIAEAYYREIPLIVLSADRPPEMIDQRDGQTIRQFEALKNHVKGSWNLPTLLLDNAGDSYQNQLIEAIKESQYLPRGPVHINVPFREPFYPSGSEKLVFHPLNIEPSPKVRPEPSNIIDLRAYTKVLLLIGQYDADTELDKKITQIGKKIPVLRSPLNNLTSGIYRYDAFLKDQEELRPEVLITAGLSVLSKKTKQWIRKYKPIKHIHVDPAGVYVDTYKTQPDLIKANLTTQLEQLKLGCISPSYLKSWRVLSEKISTALPPFFGDAIYSESRAAYEVLKQIPTNSFLHLSNSMPVRYADLFGVKEKVTVFANRGTSGIDGCTSTMMGTALVSDQLQVLLTGDLAFFYDRNAFFHNHLPRNIRIIILNNQGGGIFRLIDGPSKLPELEAYFETKHNRTAEYLCKENSLIYQSVDTLNDLQNALSSFFKTGHVLEIFTNPTTNQSHYKQLKKYIHEQINNSLETGR